MLLIHVLFSQIPVDDGTESNAATFIDEGLFQRIATGDSEALEKLYHATERTLYAYALALTRNHDHAVDLIQECYLKVMGAAHLYRPMGKPLAWLFTITRNLYLMDYRKQKRMTPYDPQDFEKAYPFSFVESSEDRIVLEGALTQLTEQEREIVLLYAVSGLKHKDIAEHLNLSLNTVLSKYHRALKKLKRHLEERGVKYE
ncbi:MAG TPA: RNA polymerase sigma factor [Clostridiales bacterium UBA8960]|jgi:RNA polymerase sigma-70 factor (ECF subfamily)|nr:RNA polymerase sigma factor [Clostridiales bacterium UBA8960]